MKVLVYGSQGWIGQQVINELKKQNIYFIEGMSSPKDLRQSASGMSKS